MKAQNSASAQAAVSYSDEAERPSAHVGQQGQPQLAASQKFVPDHSPQDSTTA